MSLRSCAKQASYIRNASKMKTTKTQYPRTNSKDRPKLRCYKKGSQVVLTSCTAVSVAKTHVFQTSSPFFPHKSICDAKVVEKMGELPSLDKISRGSFRRPQHIHH